MPFGDEGCAALAAHLPPSLRVLNVEAHESRQTPLAWPMALQNMRVAATIDLFRRFYRGDAAARAAMAAEVEAAGEAVEETLSDAHGPRHCRGGQCGAEAHQDGKHCFLWPATTA